MSALKLHVEGLWDSPWVFHAVVALEEKRLSYDVVVEELPLVGARREALEAQAMLAKVPLLVHDGLAFTESLAISEYLAETFPYPDHPRLFPADLKERARARQVMMFLRTDLLALRAERPASSIFLDRPARSPLTSAASAQADALRALAGRLVGRGRTSLFAEWCIADADLALALMRLLANGDPVPGPLADYTRAVWTRPSIQSFVTRDRPR